MRVAGYVWAVADISAQVKTGATQKSEGEETHTRPPIREGFSEKINFRCSFFPLFFSFRSHGAVRAE